MTNPSKFKLDFVEITPEDITESFLLPVFADSNRVYSFKIGKSEFCLINIDLFNDLTIESDRKDKPNVKGSLPLANNADWDRFLDLASKNSDPADGNSPDKVTKVSFLEGVNLIGKGIESSPVILGDGIHQEKVILTKTQLFEFVKHIFT